MRVIIVDKEDWEPLTIVEIPAYLRKHPQVTMLLDVDIPIEPTYEPLEAFTVDLEWIPLHGVGPSFHMAFARDPEKALLLRAAFLPGQRGHLHRNPGEALYMAGVRLVWK